MSVDIHQSTLILFGFIIYQLYVGISSKYIIYSRFWNNGELPINSPFVWERNVSANLPEFPYYKANTDHIFSNLRPLMGVFWAVPFRCHYNNTNFSVCQVFLLFFLLTINNFFCILNKRKEELKCLNIE